MGLDGAPAPGARIGRDRLGLDPDPSDDGVGIGGPAGGGVVGRGDLRAGHVLGLGPRVGVDACVGAPHRGVAFGRDREVTALLNGRLRQFAAEVAGVGSHPQPVSCGRLRCGPARGSRPTLVAAGRLPAVERRHCRPATPPPCSPRPLPRSPGAGDRPVARRSCRQPPACAIRRPLRRWSPCQW